MPLGAQKATLLGAASSGAGGFKAFGGDIIDFTSSVSPVTGAMRAHVFNGTGKMFVMSGEKDVHYWIVAGGGAMATQGSGQNGTGAGGVRASLVQTSTSGGTASLPVVNMTASGGPSSDGIYPIVVGAGGTRPNTHNTANGSGPWAAGDSNPYARGANSSALGLTASGGAPASFGGGATPSPYGNGGNGAGGGGGNAPAGTGNSGGYSPAEGTDGGPSIAYSGWYAPCSGGGGGGGGTSSAGAQGAGNGGAGGNGTYINWCGFPEYMGVGGGGGGGAGYTCGNWAGYAYYGGGRGAPSTGIPGGDTQGTACRGMNNTGGGSGGSHANTGGAYNRPQGGGSGIVIIAYPRG